MDDKNVFIDKIMELLDLSDFSEEERGKVKEIMQSEAQLVIDLINDRFKGNWEDNMDEEKLEVLGNIAYSIAYQKAKLLSMVKEVV